MATPTADVAALATARSVRMALAAHAYLTDTVRLVERNLTGFSHLVATRRGLFAINRDARLLIAYGQFFGITMRDSVIYIFEACDRGSADTHRGRIIRLWRDGDHITGADVFATGLDNGCHQIDIIHDRLCVLDTYNQQIFRYPLNGDPRDIVRPIVGGKANDWDEGYVHFNALIASDDDILLMLHNGAAKTERLSEIAQLDREWQLVKRSSVDGMGCHNLAILENGTVLSCGSFDGELIATDGLKVSVCDMMTRGLSVDDEQIVVGGSVFGDRGTRDEMHGAVFFLDRAYRQFARVAIPAPPMEIRKIDGRDRSLSDDLAHRGDG